MARVLLASDAMHPPPAPARPQLAGLRSSLLVTVLLAVACSDSDHGDAPAISGSQVTLNHVFQGARPQILAAIVDDTPNAVELREAVADGLENLIALHRSRNESCAPPFDPAAWHPIDLSAVIVHPSRALGTRYSGPADDAALRWVSTQQTDEDNAAWAAAVRAAIEITAPPNSAFQPLSAFRDAVTLVGRARLPVDSEELALMAVLPHTDIAGVLLAAATEDQGSEAPEALALTSLPPSIYAGSLIVPALEPTPGAACQDSRGPSTRRFEAWLAAQSGSFEEEYWPCAEPDVFNPFFTDCATSCLMRPIRVDENGLAECRITVRAAMLTPCPEELGWFDPLGADGAPEPEFIDEAGVRFRVCEVRQLEGPAGEACRSALDCAGCEPGWCATRVPELVPSDRCASGEHYPPFRFVLGAGQARSALGTIVCALQTEQ